MFHHHTIRTRFITPAALLCRQSDIVRWDHDSDLSMMHPGHERLAQLLDTLRTKVPDIAEECVFVNR